MMPLLRCLKDDNATWFWMTVDLCNEDSSLWPEKDKKNYLFDAYHVKSYEPISTI